MILFYKRMPVLLPGIAVACASLFSSCSKEDVPAEDTTIILQENFDNADNATWPTGSSGDIVTAIKNGWYVVSYTSEDIGTHSLWSPNNIFPAGQKTGSIELVIRHSAGHAQDKAALLFWLADNRNYVAFTIGEKEFRIFQVVSGQVTNLVNWTPSTAIRGKINEENKLRVRLTQEKMMFYINDEKMVEMGKEVASAPDKLGFQITKASTEVGVSSYEVDYIRVTK